MINLLPLEEKQKLSLKNKEKLTVVLGIVVLVSLVCFALVLLSIKFYILAKTDYQKNILEQEEKKYQTPDFMGFSDNIQKYNATLTQLNSFYKKEIYFNQAFKIIIDIPSPKDLYLTSFSLNRNENGIVLANVSGVSNTRENLLIFRKNIEMVKEIINPYFSPGSWASPENVSFSLTFEINQNEEQ